MDALSELLRTGRMNELGRFEEDGGRITLDARRDVFLLESDVNELAQAKGANVAGLQVVCSEYGVSFDDIDVFYLAGGFGRHLDIAASRRIGLVPDLPDDRIVRVGNAAIEGATAALLSTEKRRELEALVTRVEHCRLETHPQFFDFFVDGCQFRPLVARARAPRGLRRSIDRGRQWTSADDCTRGHGSPRSTSSRPSTRGCSDIRRVACPRSRGGARRLGTRVVRGPRPPMGGAPRIGSAH